MKICDIDSMIDKEQIAKEILHNKTFFQVVQLNFLLMPVQYMTLIFL